MFTAKTVIEFPAAEIRVQIVGDCSGYQMYSFCGAEACENTAPSEEPGLLPHPTHRILVAQVPVVLNHLRVNVADPLADLTF